jgi:hypothetical protein
MKMAEITQKVIKDHGDGDFDIEVPARFTFYTPTTPRDKVNREFHDVMERFAI